ncbi:LacI family transcriptional regulator [bacterium 1XD8-76]|nr:LacI family transcriptional regulator [bacterium 1XD8-76]
MAVTIEDVAREAQVSIATVSRVINGSKAVSPKLQKRVQGVIEKTNFKPNTFARGLTTNKSNIIGIVVADISNWVIASLIKGINHVCQERGYTLLVCESGGEKENELRLLQHLEEQRVCGALLTAVDITPELVQRIFELPYPMVLATQEATDGKHKITTVIHDNVKAITDAVNFLLANGHRRIAFIGGPENDYSSGRKRLEGFMHAAELFELEVPENYIVHGNFTFESGRDCMRKIYEENVELPTAILACSDLMAIGAMSFARNSGLRVPDDISFMGFDDSDLAMYFHPALSTIRISYFDEGEQAAKKLFHLIDTGIKTTGEITYIPHQVIRRASVRRL